MKPQNMNVHPFPFVQFVTWLWRAGSTSENVARPPLAARPGGGAAQSGKEGRDVRIVRQPANVGEYGRQWGQKDPLHTRSRPTGPATPTVDEQPVMAVAGLGPVAKLARSHSCFQLEPGRCLGRQTFRWIFLLANRCLICENHFRPGLRTRRFSWHQTQGQSSQLQANKGE